MDEERARQLLREAGRFFAQRRRKVEGRCAVCGQAFVATPRRRYCSGRCNVAAFRARQRQQQQGDD